MTVHSADTPLEIIIQDSIHQDYQLDASFQRLFHVDQKPYVALKKGDKVFLLKIIDDKYPKLSNITDNCEFERVLSVYQALL